MSHITKDKAAKPAERLKETSSGESKIIFWETVNIIFKTTGVITWFFILLLTVLELKRYFDFDLIPGYNSAIDDVYNAVRGVLMP